MTAQRFDAAHLAHVIAFLEAQAADSRRQACKETGQGQTFYQGRVSAFELALSVLRRDGDDHAAH
ncbi:hypothetical protein [Zoogloea sp.]|uniref:hypothetical protein n=1 Tax=Zoogloea sp. TaxID=49181 RepID=UPI0035B1E5DC